MQLPQLLTTSTLFTTSILSSPASDTNLINLSSAPPGTTIKSITITGSGCRANSGHVSTPSNSVIILTSPDLDAAIGPGHAITDMYKFCQVAVGVRYPEGWQFAVRRGEVKGYVELGEGVRATQAGVVYFAGDASQQTFNTDFDGETSRPYVVSYDESDEDAALWSPCGNESILNVKVSAVVNGPGGPRGGGTGRLGVDETRVIVMWRKC